MRPLLNVLVLAVAVLVTAPCSAQPAQSAVAKECIRLNAVPADQIPWDQHERVYKQWAAICEQALAPILQVKAAIVTAIPTEGLYFRVT